MIRGEVEARAKSREKKLLPLLRGKKPDGCPGIHQPVSQEKKLISRLIGQEKNSSQILCPGPLPRSLMVHPLIWKNEPVNLDVQRSYNVGKPLATPQERFLLISLFLSHSFTYKSSRFLNTFLQMAYFARRCDFSKSHREMTPGLLATY